MLLLGGVRPRLAALKRSAALSRIAGGDLVFVGGEGCKDLALLTLGDLEKVESRPSSRGDLIKFCGRNLKVAVGFLKSERGRTGLGGLVLEWSTRNVADPQRSRIDPNRDQKEISAKRRDGDHAYHNQNKPARQVLVASCYPNMEPLPLE